MIKYVAWVAAALSLTPGQAEVLDFSLTPAINLEASWTQFDEPTPNRFQDGVGDEMSGAVGGAPIVRGPGEADALDEAHGGGFEVHSPSIFSVGTSDLDLGMPPALVAGGRSTWATMILGFAGLNF